ncbi:hypothetical protein CLOM_g21592 [Closterium sp. NIES-68]|nr:hypothetical protein CLOM_g21592 [Closterium sp. NIES-68]GJP59816.1 hypothetical protein CLOP_g15307 [Closterium sp. NIES-67]
MREAKRFASSLFAPGNPRALLFLQLLLVLPCVVIVALLFSVPRAYKPSKPGLISQRFAAINAELATVAEPAGAAAAGGTDGGGGAAAAAATAAAAMLAAKQQEPVQAMEVHVAVSDPKARREEAARKQAQAERTRRERLSALVRGKSSCGCFQTVTGPGGAFHVLCTCDLLCWDGRQLIAQTANPQAPIPCKHLTSDVAFGTPITALDCRTKINGQDPLDLVRKAGEFRPIATRPSDWIAKRKGPVAWRLGRSFIQRMEASTEDVSAFVARFFPILLVNNATVPGLLPPVHRFVFPRDSYYRAVLKGLGPDGFQVGVLEQLLAAAFESSSTGGNSSSAAGGDGEAASREWERAKLVDPQEPGAERASVEDEGGRKVEFEGQWAAATEDAPMCFEHVVLPGVLDGTIYPLGRIQAELFLQKVDAKLGLAGAGGAADATAPASAAAPASSASPEPTPAATTTAADAATTAPPDASNLVFVRQADAAVRSLVPDSHDLLISTLRTKLSFTVSEAAMRDTSFARSYTAIRRADIILGLHGEELATAAAFASRETPVVEIMPFHVYSPRFESLVLSSGLPYLQHQCHPGPFWPLNPAAADAAKRPPAAASQGLPGAVVEEAKTWAEADVAFLNVTVADCFAESIKGVGGDAALGCRKHFLRDRPVRLWEEDIGGISVLLSLARNISQAATTGKIIVQGPSLSSASSASSAAVSAPLTASDEVAVGVVMHGALEGVCAWHGLDLGYCRQDFVQLPLGGDGEVVLSFGGVSGDAGAGAVAGAAAGAATVNGTECVVARKCWNSEGWVQAR